MHYVYRSVLGKRPFYFTVVCTNLDCLLYHLAHSMLNYFTTQHWLRCACHMHTAATLPCKKIKLGLMNHCASFDPLKQLSERLQHLKITCAQENILAIAC